MAEPRMVLKRCARSGCGRSFRAPVTDPFVTCPQCRVPVSSDRGGCTRYQMVNNNGGGESIAKYRRGTTNL
jgi:hypothetical protein